MTTHSSIPAWENPWTEELGGLQSKRSQTVRHRHNLVTKQQQKIIIITIANNDQVLKVPHPYCAAPVWTQLLLPASLPGGSVITIYEETEARPCE